MHNDSELLQGRIGECEFIEKGVEADRFADVAELDARRGIGFLGEAQHVTGGDIKEFGTLVAIRQSGDFLPALKELLRCYDLSLAVFKEVCWIDFTQNFACPQIDAAVALDQLAVADAEQQPGRRIINRVVIDVGPISDPCRD